MDFCTVFHCNSFLLRVVTMLPRKHLFQEIVSVKVQLGSSHQKIGIQLSLVGGAKISWQVRSKVRIKGFQTSKSSDRNCQRTFSPLYFLLCTMANNIKNGSVFFAFYLFDCLGNYSYKNDWIPILSGRSLFDIL